MSQIHFISKLRFLHNHTVLCCSELRYQYWFCFAATHHTPSLNLTLTHPKLQKVASQEKSDYATEGASYGHEIAAWAATPEWRAAGGQCLWCGRSLVQILGGTPLFWLLPFWGDSLEMRRRACLVKVSNAFNFSLPIPNPPKGYKRLQGGVKKMSDYTTEGGLTWARNRCTRVACCRWTVPVVREVPVQILGEPPFLTPPFPRR